MHARPLCNVSSSAMTAEIGSVDTFALSELLLVAA
jgi:hypothetical protein